MILLFLSLSVSCNPEPKYTAEEWEQKEIEKEKSYRITTYELSTEYQIILTALITEGEFKRLFSYNNYKALVKDIVNDNFDFGFIDENVLQELKKNTYYATEIINYSDTDCRFIDRNTALEKFLSADYIEIEQIK